MIKRPLRAPYAFAADASGLAGANANSEGMWWQGSSYWLDMANGYGMWGGAPTVLSSLIADTHAQTIEANDTTGFYSPFTANTFVRTDNGAQVVPTRTNLLERSQSINTAPSPWTQQSVTVTADAAIAPDGATTGDLLIPSVSSAIHRLQVNPASAVVAATTYTVSIYAKAGGYRYLYMNSAGTFGARATFDLQNGVITQIATGSATITAFANGWYLCTMTGPAASTSSQFYLQVNSTVTNAADDTFSGDGTSGIYLWQGQLEAGSFASPPIPTTTTSVQVNGNQQVISGQSALLAPGFGGVLQVDLKDPGLVGNTTLLNIYADGNNRVSLFCGSGGTLRIVVITAGANQGEVSAGSWAQGVQTIAFAAGPDFMKIRLVGGTDPTADVSVTWPNPTFIGFGAGYSPTVNAFAFNRKLALFPGPQDASTFAALFAQAQIAAVQ